MSQQPQSTAPPTSTLAIVALVLSFFCFPVGLILGIIALIRIENRKGSLGGKTLAIVAIVVNLVAVPMVGIMAAIAIPNFVQFQCRSKQSEAKGNLKALYVGEESYRAETDSYSGDLKTIQFEPRGAKLRYEYFVVSAGKEAFVAEARGTGDMAGDVWRITNTNQLEAVQDICRR